MVLGGFILFTSCSKESRTWDVRLNGRWTEDIPANAKSLPSGCDLLFNDNYFEICQQGLTSDVNTKSSLYSNDGQLYIEYNLGLKRHIEHRYDYEFEGEYLWLVEETTEKNTGARTVSGAKKYRKI
jgi:hypothetical protein